MTNPARSPEPTGERKPTWDDVAEVVKMAGGTVAVRLLDGSTHFITHQELADLVEAAMRHD